MLKKWLIVGCTSLLFISTSIKSQTLVCESCAYTSIVEAVNNSMPYDTIIVKSGTYREHDILINKPLTIIGDSATVIDGEKIGTIIKIQADDVHISSMKLERVGLSHTQEFAAIHVSDSENFTLNNIIVEDAFFGFLIEGSKNGVITGNSLSGLSDMEFFSGNGIHGWKSSNLTITNNQIHNLRDAIYLEFVNDSFVSENLSEHNIRYGLHFMFSNNNAYRNNIFRENGAGVAVMFSKFIEMKDNLFENNWGTASFGLLLKEIYDAEIEGNTFSENTVAISVEGSTRINYIGNTFVQNGWAIKMSGGCYNNAFFTNSFSNNSFDLSFNSRLNDNLFSGNYWSTYNGYDLDKDGIGDVPHRPVKLFSYVVNRTPESIILLRSIFVDLINFTENVTPIFTPVDLIDESPLMKAPS